MLLANVRASPYQFLKTLTSAFTTTSQTRASEFAIFTPRILSFVLQLRPSTFAEYKCKMDRANVDTSNSDLTKNLSNLVSNCEWQRLSSHPFSIEVEMQKLQEVKLKIFFLLKHAHRSSHFCSLLELEWWERYIFCPISSKHMSSRRRLVVLSEIAPPEVTMSPFRVRFGCPFISISKPYTT